MDVAEVQSIAREFAPAVSGYVTQALQPIIWRIEAIERRLDAFPAARDGRDGRDADPADIERLVERAVSHLAPQPGPPGEPGRDGKDADPETIADILGRSVEAIATRLPAGAPGEPGRDGKDGADGKDGSSVAGERGPPGRDGVDGADGTSVTLDDVAPLIETAVAKAMAAVPAGRDGAPGQDASPEMIAPMIRAETDMLRRALQSEIERLPDFVAMEVAEAVAKASLAGRDGKDGKDGADGRDGADGIDGKDGTSISAADMRAKVERQIASSAVADLPAQIAAALSSVPREPDTLTLSMMIKGAVENAVAAIPLPERGPQGADGEPGPQGEAGAQGPAGKDGESIKGDPGEMGPAGDPGRDGQDADQEALQARLREAVTEAVAALPTAEPGRDGKDGIDGRDGKDAEIDQAAIDAVIQKAIEALPKPERGEPGPQGERGEMGATGVGVAGAVIDREGVLVLTLSDGTTKSLSRVVGADGVSIDPSAVIAMVEREVAKFPAPRDGRDGADGKDGQDGKDGRDGIDGFGFDDLEFVQDGERRAFLRFVHGERVKEFIVGLPGQIYRGVWKPDVAYQRGDTVTWGGSLFIVMKDDPEGKPEASQDFRLAVKRGRDGKDGKDGRPGEKGIPGAEGRPGRDGISYPQA